MSLKRKLSDNTKLRKLENDDLVEEIVYQSNKKTRLEKLPDLGDLPTQEMSTTSESSVNSKNTYLLNSDKKDNEDDIIATIEYMQEGTLKHFEIKKSSFINSDIIKIGRSSSCDIKLNDLLISSVHIQLSLNKSKDKVQAKCVGRNGTFINNSKTRDNEIYLLNDKDKLVLGEKIELTIKYTKNKKSLEDNYTIGEQLGVGNYAVVRYGVNKTTGKKVAIKEFFKQNIKDLNTFKKESEILINMKHMNIIKLFESFVEPVPNQHQFFKSYLVMDYANGGELFNRIVKKGKLRVDESKDIFRQLLSGVKYLHLHNIIHRDIKPENVLLDIKYRDPNDNDSDETKMQLGPWDENEISVTVKLADFGLAKFIGGEQNKVTETMCGSPGYVSPEILLHKPYSEKTDMWSLGVLLYILLCGFPPFSDQLGPPSMKEQIIQAKYAFYSPYWDEIPDIALDLISHLLELDTKKRFSIIQAVNHPFFNDIIPQSQFHKFINRIAPSQQQDSYLSQQAVKLVK